MKKKNHQNLVIVLLILALFIMVAITFSNNKHIDDRTIEDINDLENFNFLAFVEDVFPYKKVYELLAKKIFSIDITNPITFIQTQFSASTFYSNSEMNETDKRTEENKVAPKDSKIQSADLESSITVRAKAVTYSGDGSIEYDEDDLGEESEGIYLIRDNNTIDSLKNTNSIDFSNIDMPAKIVWSSELPQILIYHTHGTEAYKPASEGNFHTLKKEYSVFVVGEILASELEKRGFNVIHDIMYHNYPSFGGSYSRSLERAEKILKANPSIKVVLDVHRDGFNHIHLNPNINSIIKNNQVKINGEISTRFQVVIGAETPNRNEVENFAELIKTVSDVMFPGFSKPVLAKPYGRFNQFLSDYYLLLEVGSNANTIEEARRSAHHLAEVIATSLNKISSNY
ncbi:MAG: stage II sporulation protein P [Alkaliphilus sp.]